MTLPVAADALRFAAPLAALAAIGFFALTWWAALPLLALLAAVLIFFRDPRRTPPADEQAILAAADGVVTDVDPDWPGDDLLPPGPRVGVFLSVLDVHINRAPTSGEVISTHYRPGRFHNALRSTSSMENESNLIRLRLGSHVVGVKQIAGAIARRIVCSCRPGDRLERGQRIGLIRFGSRTEHYLPTDSEVSVHVGDRVRGGETILGWLPSESDEKEVA
jgi:phosphatidylserine decarboxylase